MVTGTCDVYNSTETKLQQCYEIQKCVNQALISDGRNMYVLDKVFRSSKPRPAVAVIINYHLRWTEITTQANSSGDGLLNEEIQRENGNLTESVDTGDNMTQILKIQIGWSSSGIYTAVQPEILLSLQPGFLLLIVGVAIDNFGYPKTTDLYLNLSQCNLPSHTNYANYNEELKEALEHLTMRVGLHTIVCTCLLQLPEVHVYIKIAWLVQNFMGNNDNNITTYHYIHIYTYKKYSDFLYALIGSQITIIISPLTTA